jgi:predicted enzyme related to lactoylglutathione lyase
MGTPLVHSELIVPDTEKARDFYGKVFDWVFDDMTFPGYTLIHTGRDMHGGLMARHLASASPGLNSYFEVDDVNRTLHDVIEFGGRVVVPRTAIAHVGEFAMFQDPEGIAVGILHPVRH